MRRLHRNKRGFTLIETLVAMVILTGGIMVLANSWSGNFMRVRNSRINNIMATLLERRMSEYEITYKEKPINELPEEESGDFGAKFPGYRWTMKSKPFELPNMTGALTAREGGVDEMTLMVVRMSSEYIKEAVKEISVTVYYKGRKGKELQNTVTTYLVDYTKEIPMNGIPGAGGGAGGLGGLGGGAGGGGS